MLCSQPAHLWKCVLAIAFVLVIMQTWRYSQLDEESKLSASLPQKQNLRDQMFNQEPDINPADGPKDASEVEANVKPNEASIGIVKDKSKDTHTIEDKPTTTTLKQPEDDEPSSTSTDSSNTSETLSESPISESGKSIEETLSESTSSTASVEQTPSESRSKQNKQSRPEGKAEGNTTGVGYSIKTTGQCKEHQHIYFLKVHKAGSTTIQNLFWRFAVTRGLSVAVFTQRFPYPNPDFQSLLLPNPTFSGFDGHYDIFCEHSIFNPKQLMESMKPNTDNVAILREPVARLRSSLKFYGYQKRNHLGDAADVVEHWLNNDKVIGKNQTRVAKEFGWSDDTKVNFDSFIEQVSPKFSVVAILKHLDKSLILMKRRLCWKFKDLIYLPMRKQAHAKVDKDVAKENRQREEYRNFVPTEFALYEHFKKKLFDEIALEEMDFTKEIATFVKISDDAKHFCTKLCQQLGEGVKTNANHETMLSYLNSTIQFEATAWEEEFEVSGLECIMNMFNPDVYRRSQVITQYPGICSKSVNGVTVFDLYCHEHFAYSFPWDLIYLKDTKSPYLFDCY